MVFKKFTIGVVVRLTLLTGLIAASVLVWLSTSWLFTQLVLSVFVVVVLVELFRFITKTNKDLAKFINAINYQDYQVSFSGYRLGNAFEELHETFRKTIHLFRDLKIEKEAHYHYLNLLVKQLKVGIITYDAEGEITLYNPMAENLLGSPNLKRWERYRETTPVFYERIVGLEGGSKALVELQKSGRELAVHVDRISMQDQVFTLIVFQDIKNEVDDRELTAWNQLIRILTHEIMNSVTPIVSLTDTLMGLAKNSENDDLVLGLKTIQRRGQGLVRFVDDYRKLISIPAPNMKEMMVPDFMEHVYQLHTSQMEEAGIKFQLNLTHRGKIELDTNLMEQVFINLLSNAIHAVEDEVAPVISIGATLETQGVLMYVADNGKGISKDQLGEIFVPFFSTRSNGSGIGLSLAKQVVHQHNGTIKVESQPGEGSVFKVLLPVR